MGFSKAPSRPLNYYGEDHGYRYIVLERLEYDLMKLAESPVPISKISKIGIEILEGFQELHTKHYCFVDVKPDNFMIKKDKVYFVDFGFPRFAFAFLAWAFAVQLFTYCNGFPVVFAFLDRTLAVQSLVVLVLSLEFQ